MSAAHSKVAQAPTAGESMDDDYAELVLSLVEQIPSGQVATYGDIAEMVGRGGPRQVGHVMARFGGGVPWWRVVRADGRPARSLEETGLRLLKADKTPIKGDRVDMARARFRIDNLSG
jgi:methylated-DNA-protein-cysteine methyltransferase related protein